VRIRTQATHMERSLLATKCLQNFQKAYSNRKISLGQMKVLRVYKLKEL
jgi:hypothetical protein